MELGYAFFILLLYVVLVVVGICFYEYWEKCQEWKKPVKIPVLNEKEKRQRLSELIEPFGFAYDEKQDIFYSRMDNRKRKYGYGRIYDEAARNMIIDYEPVYFEYDEKKWMIEFWKGQYGMLTGGEVDVYYLPKDEIEEGMLQPCCAETKDMLRVQTALWKNGKQLYYRRDYHWWLNGFVLGEFSKPRELEMDIEIVLKDMEMKDAFLHGLHEAGYQNGELSVVGNTVWIHFTKPHTRQPITRFRLFSTIKQMENKRNCRRYRKVTRDYANAYDKILALEVRMAQLYEKLEMQGKSRSV